MPTMYDNMTFPDYQHREYPKFIQTGEKKDANTGHKVATGVLVHSLAEEEAITRPKQPEAPAKPESAPVATQNAMTAAARPAEPDEPAPRPRGRPPGSGKTDPLAKVDPDQDPDA